MTLTGLPLLALTVAATVAAGAATAWSWPRGGRLRPVTRTAGVLLVEVLVVLTAGLAVNRHEQFYPSWQALRGDTGTVAVADHLRAGSLDARMRSTRFPWRPPELTAWHLTGPPTVALPRDYRARPDVTFPVVLVLTAPGEHARHTPEAVTVTLTPSATTTAAALRSLPTALGHDLRVAAVGWDVVGAGPLPAAIVAAEPPGFAVLNQPTGALPPALAAPLRLPSNGRPT